MKVVVLTGAGISAESGIRTFRASDGLWEDHRVEDVATPEGFARNPELVYRFYNERRAQLADVEPNKAHLALYQLEEHLGDDFTLVTQNVDDLHERAGNRVIHMHGALKEAWCRACDLVAAWEGDLDSSSECPYCKRSGKMRPNIVWFGEIPYYMNEIERALQNCAVFAAIGTSGQVYPAAGFVSLAKMYGARCVEINLERSAVAGQFDQGFYGAATQQVPLWVEQIIHSH